MDHKLGEHTEGAGNMQSITPICECGWKGVAAYAYNDDQLTDVRNQGMRHLKQAQVGGKSLANS